MKRNHQNTKMGTQLDTFVWDFIFEICWDMVEEELEMTAEISRKLVTCLLSSSTNNFYHHSKRVKSPKMNACCGSSPLKTQLIFTFNSVLIVFVLCCQTFFPNSNFRVYDFTIFADFCCTPFH